MRTLEAKASAPVGGDGGAERADVASLHVRLPELDAREREGTKGALIEVTKHALSRAHAH